MPQPQSPTSKTNPIVIKKYANRRLYNTDTSSYVTLDDLCRMIKEGEEVVVYDAKTGDDITRSVLTQIIVEQEGKEGQNLLPTPFLRQLISMYGNNMPGLLPRYLEYAMQAFTKNQNQMQDYFRGTFGNAFGGMFSNTFEEVSKQNMHMFEQAMRVFAPFANMPSAAPSSSSSSAPQSAPKQSAPEPEEEGVEPAPSHLRAVETPQHVDEDLPEQEDSSIRDMQARLNDLQKQIANMQKGDE